MHSNVRKITSANNDFEFKKENKTKKHQVDRTKYFLQFMTTSDFYKQADKKKKRE